MKEMFQPDDELYEKIALTSSIWNVGEEFPKVEFNFHVDKMMETNVYLSNEGIKKQLQILMELNPERKTHHYFYYIKIPQKEYFG